MDYLSDNSNVVGINLPFNTRPSTKLHIDLNSCFASVEQQANPLLRGKPIVVAAYASDWGCILAPSREAKPLGIKTGMRVKEARMIYPKLIVLPPDPWKYRNVHLRLHKLLSRYTDKLVPKSIDEFVMDFEHSPYLKRGIFDLATEMKQRIRREIGDFLTVSVGIAPNRFLAKTGAGLHKPDGLDEINQSNFLEVYSKLELTDLCGIAFRNARRLQQMGVKTVLDFYEAPIWKLKAVFESIVGYYWYVRLRGFEIDEVEQKRRTYGNSFALPPNRASFEKLVPVLQKLVEKMGARIRRGGYKAGGVHLRVSFRGGGHWAHGEKLNRIIFDSREIYQVAYEMLQKCPVKLPVRVLMVSCFELSDNRFSQLELFKDVAKQERVVSSIDEINNRYGSFVVSPATMMAAADLVHDRIAFGGVKELEEFSAAM